MIGIFLVSVNVFSAQLWSETCKKFSPIEYLECTVFAEDATMEDRVYLPDILKGEEMERKKETSEDDEKEEQDGPYASSGDELMGKNGSYGTFRGKRR